MRTGDVFIGIALRIIYNMDATVRGILINHGHRLRLGRTQRFFHPLAVNEKKRTEQDKMRNTNHTEDEKGRGCITALARYRNESL